MEKFESVQLEEILTDFFNLYYTKSDSKLQNKLIDFSIDNYILVRLGELGCNIYYLSTGYYIYIPWIWVDLFTSLDMYAGNRICTDQVNSESYLLNFTKTMIIITQYLQRGGLTKVDKGLLDHLGNLAELKSLKFRNYIDTKFNLYLSPIELNIKTKLIII